ncbi:hypothetical protein BTJ40_18170 [Microbulbifer sp. A4B17]|nr:hypothetical protein BTJ40_18170 [Microbulbifer sp. A4B17]
MSGTPLAHNWYTLMHLLKRPDSPHLYFNLRLPKSSRFLRFSLHTVDRDKASKRALYLARKVKQWHWLGMDYEQIKRNAYEQAIKFRDDWLDEFFSEGGYALYSYDAKQLLAEHLGESVESGPQVELDLEETEEELLSRGVRPERKATTLRARIGKLQRQLLRAQQRLVSGLSTPDEVEDDLVDLLGAQLTIEALEQHRRPERVTELLNTTSQAASAAIAVDKVSSPSPKFSELYQGCVDNKKAETIANPLGQGTYDALRLAAEDFLWVFGDISLNAFKVKDAMHFRDVLLIGPSNRKKYPDLTPEAVLSGDAEFGKRMSATTVGERLLYVSQIFEYGVRFEYISKNPFKGITVQRDTPKMPAYSQEDLERIFKSPLFVSGSSYWKRSARQSHF